jgi:hypothetical protein
MADRTYNWDAIREGLKRIGTQNPEFLANTVLVGGAACWYYRLALSKANDSDFPAPVYTPDQERVWLSKDLDRTAGGSRHERVAQRGQGVQNGRQPLLRTGHPVQPSFAHCGCRACA